MKVSENSVCYVEVITNEIDETCELHSKQFGWSFSSAIMELGNARVAELSDGSLYAVRAPMHEAENPTIRNYTKVANLARAVEDAKLLGATLLLERMEIPNYGIIAIYELGGNEFGLWE
jgi:predicted enzyme related to lactoylglutathione lyase